jgi:ribosomal-protein-alanine N-acetyltransferase
MRPPQNKWDETNWDEKYLTVTEFRKILHRQKDLARRDESHIFGVFRNDDGALIGSVGLNDISRGLFQNAFLGYRIHNPHWGYGYAKEAVKAALDIGFKDLGLHRIEAGIEPRNLQSVAVAKACKLRYEGLSPKRLYYKDRWVDLLIFAATSEKFKIKYRFPQKDSDRRRR